MWQLIRTRLAATPTTRTGKSKTADWLIVCFGNTTISMDIIMIGGSSQKIMVLACTSSVRSRDAASPTPLLDPEMTTVFWPSLSYGSEVTAAY
jgi:hypothetical protein